MLFEQNDVLRLAIADFNCSDGAKKCQSDGVRSGV